MQNIQEQGVRDEDLVLLLESVPGNEWIENSAHVPWWNVREF
jgi:hypothetical protein